MNVQRDKSAYQGSGSGADALRNNRAAKENNTRKLVGITNALSRVGGSSEQNRKQYQEYKNTVASQNAADLKREQTMYERGAEIRRTEELRRLEAERSAAQEMKRQRKWEVFPGRNTFYCGGRIVMAKRAGLFYLTLGLVVVTSTIFFACDCPYLGEKVSPAIPVVAAVLFLFVVSNLFKTSFSDPGIIPRATRAEAMDNERQEGVDCGNGAAYRPPPRTREVLIKNQTIKLKYCFTCRIFRPPRTSHCSICDNCVERFDHHCPWVGNCVGKRNYRFFYLFLVSLAVHCVYIFACSVTHLVLLTKEGPGGNEHDSTISPEQSTSRSYYSSNQHHYSNPYSSSGNHDFINALKESPASIIVCVICFFSMWSVLGLAGFHTYLTSTNLTTNEDIKGAYSSKRTHTNFNPFSAGSLFTNCNDVLCSPLNPSLIDATGIVTEKYLAERKLSQLQAELQQQQQVPAAGQIGVLGSYPRQQPPQSGPGRRTYNPTSVGQSGSHIVNSSEYLLPKNNGQLVSSDTTISATNGPNLLSSSSALTSSSTSPPSSQSNNFSQDNGTTTMQASEYPTKIATALSTENKYVYTREANNSKSISRSARGGSVLTKQNINDHNSLNSPAKEASSKYLSEGGSANHKYDRKRNRDGKHEIVVNREEVSYNASEHNDIDLDQTTMIGSALDLDSLSGDEEQGRRHILKTQDFNGCEESNFVTTKASSVSEQCKTAGISSLYQETGVRSGNAASVRHMTAQSATSNAYYQRPNNSNNFDPSAV